MWYKYNPFINNFDISWGGSKNDLWYFIDEAALVLAHPTANAGNYAVVWSTDTIWIRDDNTNSWVNSWVDLVKFIVSVTFAEITTLISTNSLNPWMRYIITDYQTKHVIQWTSIVNTWDVEWIIVAAISNNTIDSNAISSVYDTDSILYDINNTLIVGNNIYSEINYWTASWDFNITVDSSNSFIIDANPQDISTLYIYAEDSNWAWCEYTSSSVLWVDYDITDIWWWNYRITCLTGDWFPIDLTVPDSFSIYIEFGEIIDTRNWYIINRKEVVKNIETNYDFRNFKVRLFKVDWSAKAWDAWTTYSFFTQSSLAVNMQNRDDNFVIYDGSLYMNTGDMTVGITPTQPPRQIKLYWAEDNYMWFASDSWFNIDWLTWLTQSIDYIDCHTLVDDNYLFDISNKWNIKIYLSNYQSTLLKNSIYNVNIYNSGSNILSNSSLIELINSNNNIISDSNMINMTMNNNYFVEYWSNLNLLSNNAWWLHNCSMVDISTCARIDMASSRVANIGDTQDCAIYKLDWLNINGSYRVMILWTWYKYDYKFFKNTNIVIQTNQSSKNIELWYLASYISYREVNNYYFEYITIWANSKYMELSKNFINNTIGRGCWWSSYSTRFISNTGFIYNEVGDFSLHWCSFDLSNVQWNIFDFNARNIVSQWTWYLEKNVFGKEFSGISIANNVSLKNNVRWPTCGWFTANGDLNNNTRWPACYSWVISASTSKNTFHWGNSNITIPLSWSNTFTMNTLLDGAISATYSFAWATHVYNASYNKIISKRQDATPILSYVDNTMNQVVTLANA